MEIASSASPGAAVGDHLPREDRLGPDVVGDRGEDRGVLGEVDRRAAAASAGRAGSGSRPPRPSRRSPSRRCRAPAAAAARRARRAALRRPRPSSSRFSVSVCARSSPTSCALASTDRRTSSTTASRSCSCLGEERIEEARGAGVVHLACLAPLEQAAVVEEHVHELPEHVVERLHQLLADRAGPSPGGANSHSAPAGAKASVRQPRSRASASAAAASPPSSPAPKAIAMSSGSADQLDLVGERPTLAGQRERGQRALADDHRVHELDGHVPGVRARRPASGRAAISRPPRAKRSAIRWQSRASRSDSASKNVRVRLRALGQRPVEDVAAERRRHAGASAARPARPPARASRATRRSPRPSCALTRHALHARVHGIEVVEELVEVEVEVREQVDLVDQHQLAGAEHERVLEPASPRPR